METLFKNIAKAHRYFDLIRAGKHMRRLQLLKVFRSIGSRSWSIWAFWHRMSFVTSLLDLNQQA